jgi:hypothetical protein
MCMALLVLIALGTNLVVHDNKDGWYPFFSF